MWFITSQLRGLGDRSADLARAPGLQKLAGMTPWADLLADLVPGCTALRWLDRSGLLLSLAAEPYAHTVIAAMARRDLDARFLLGIGHRVSGSRRVLEEAGCAADRVLGGGIDRRFLPPLSFCVLERPAAVHTFIVESSAAPVFWLENRRLGTLLQREFDAAWRALVRPADPRDRCHGDGAKISTFTKILPRAVFSLGLEEPLGTGL